MNELETAQFEKELRRLKPVRPPELFADRLQATVAKAIQTPTAPQRRRSPQGNAWAALLRWLVPTATVAAAVMLAVRQIPELDGPSGGRAGLGSSAFALRADDVQLNQNLVASYDVVGVMPGGEPVRFRCHEWSDAMTLRDSSRGLEVEQRTPRWEVTPVRFETY